MHKTRTQKMAFSGVTAALCVAVMFLTGVIPVATLALPAVAGCFLIAVVVEAGIKWGFCVYGVVSVLSLLVVSDREAVLFFVFFFGYYPVLYAVLSRMKNRWLSITAKYAIFNAAIALETYISVVFLQIPIDEIPFLGAYTLVLWFLVANIVFFVYDRAMDGLILTYLKKIQPKVRQMFRMR